MKKLHLVLTTVNTQHIISYLRVPTIRLYFLSDAVIHYGADIPDVLERIMSWHRAKILNLGAIDNWDLVILCCGGCPRAS